MMNKSLIFSALVLLLVAACTPAVQKEVQPEQASNERFAEVLDGLSQVNYQPGKVFEAANVIRLASGEEVVVSSLELSEGHWTQLETGQWVVSTEYVQEDLAYEWLETYQGESVAEQAIFVSEVTGEADKTFSYYTTCSTAARSPEACGFLYGMWASSSPTCPCLAFCKSYSGAFSFDRIILIPCLN